MPVLARFYGIVIRMYYQQSDHNPPHIHALYGKEMASVCIRTGRVLEGELPPKALSLVREWVRMHQDDLLEMWESQVFRKLPPLE